MEFQRLGILMLLMITSLFVQAEDGYRLWLRYDKIESEAVRRTYAKQIKTIFVEGNTPTLNAAAHELTRGLSGLLGKSLETVPKFSNKSVVIGVIGQSNQIDALVSEKEVDDLEEEGFFILKKDENIYITGKDEKGILYGVFRFLRHLQMNLLLDDLKIKDSPKLQLRVLNHWDNLDGTVERGYAGFSIWNWHQLPEYIDQRYTDYARANASIGINGTVLTNVNANSLVFREDYIEKAAALAEVFRPYGIKVYLTARFSSPIELGKLKTADPLAAEVQAWWKSKVDEIYEKIPDFGGFLVKANSEGQPGPQEYGRNHADGANMLADALAPHGGVVMWRAFVYSEHDPDDRAKQAYDEFVPLDGKFRKNVLIQVKNGPIDFQPREPIHAMFGAMPNTPIMMEFQITKEYLGQGTYLVGLSKMYEEVLKTDTYRKGQGSIVAKALDGSLHGNELTGMAGVANIGTARNWTGNLFGQADWYAYGRLAWNPYEESAQIFEEWTSMTFSNEKVQTTANSLLENSHETCIQYMTPLGLHHIMATGHHFGPGPWVSELGRPEWNPVYYHRADEEGIGFDRTKTGSNALGQYHPEYQAIYSDVDQCPLELLLWYHHVPWDYKLSTGNSLWKQLCLEYHEGAAKVTQMKKDWQTLAGLLDEERYQQVLMHLNIQEKEAKWWRDACLTYFQTFSKMEIPSDLEQAAYNVNYYKSLNYPYAPGIRPRW
ncbi:MAG: alpha-glucuronidase family glycosyl hydrolase [Bacteroidota bacterium]